MGRREAWHSGTGSVVPSKDHGQQSQTHWAQIPASFTTYHHLSLSKLSNLSLGFSFSFIKWLHSHLAYRCSESFIWDNTEPGTEMMLYAYCFLFVLSSQLSGHYL